MSGQPLNTTDVARELDISLRHAQRKCSRGEYGSARKENGQWVVKGADARGVEREAAGRREAAELAEVPVAKRERAIRIAGLLGEFDAFAAGYAGRGGKRTTALAVFAAQRGISVRSLQRWQKKYRTGGVTALVDTRGGVRLERGTSPEALACFDSFYLAGQQPSVKLAWQMVAYVNEAEQRGWEIGSLPAFYRHVKEDIPRAVAVLHREGLAAYEAKCAPYIQRDPESVAPGQVWVGDHHLCNVLIRHRNEWKRVWLTAWEDMRSRAIVGMCFSMQPNQTTILRAFKDGIERHGPPDSVKIDNGKDYDSEMWTGETKQQRRVRRVLKKGYLDELMMAGLYAMVDVGVSFALPYHAQSKPVERFFDTFDRQFCKTFKTYCGKDAARKPEALAELLQSDKAIAAAHNLESFSALGREYIETVYNRQGHTGAGMDGRSPAEVMATRTSRRVLREGLADLLLRVWSGELTVGKNGVQFKQVWYGQYDQKLLSRQGKKVRVAYDPDDLRCVHVYDAATMKLITTAEQNQWVAYGTAVDDEALREAARQQNRARKNAREFRDAQLTAEMDLTTLAIKAQQAQVRPEPSAEAETATLRPVGTVLDGQLAEHARQEKQRQVRKAAGAEGGGLLEVDLTKLRQENRARKHWDVMSE